MPPDLKETPPTVALVEWTWMGHHPTYFEIYTRTLLELGCTVYALCPDPGELLQRLTGLSPDDTSRLHTGLLLGWAQAPKRTPETLRKGVAGARTFWQIRKQLKKLSSQAKHPIDLVFFTCIYDRHFYDFPFFGRLLPWRWAGLYLQSFGFRKTTSPIYAEVRGVAQPERFLKSNRLAAVATLDEGITGSIEALTGRKNAVVFPDITNEERPSRPPGLGDKIRSFAQGRPVVTLCGALYPQRGVENFIKVALLNPDWCFVLVGELPPDLREGALGNLFARFLENHPFGMVHPLSVKDGESYNSVVNSCDVLWNVHLDWPGSSNTLTKAAVFEKPVIVGAGHLLAERVRRWALGEVCTEDDLPGISAALHRILDNPKAWRDEHRPAWKEYRAEHSIRRLRKAFSELLDHLPGGCGHES